MCSPSGKALVVLHAESIAVSTNSNTIAVQNKLPRWVTRWL